MAQVKKLQDGGNPSKKYFMFNGIKIIEGDDNFKQLEQYALNGNRFAQRILETLPKSNNDIIVNTSDDGVDFKNLDMDYRNERTKKQFEKGDSFWRRTFRTKEGRDYINDAVELKFTPIVKEKEKEKEKLGTISHGNNASFIYHDQQDGSKLYSSGPQNIQNETIIRNIFNNLGTSRADLEKKYDFSNWGEDYWTLQDWKNLNPNYNVEDLISRIKQGKATDEDLELLTLMKFNTSFKKPDKKKLTGLEWNDAFSDGLVNVANLKQAAARRRVGIKKGEDGNWYVTGNSDFTKGTWYTGDLDFLEGTKYANGAIHNGRLFTKDQILNGDPEIMQYIAPFISAWRNASDYRAGYDAANKSGVRFVGDRLWNNASEDHYGPFHTQFDPTSQYHKIWSKYFDDLNTEYPWNVTDVTNAYNNLNGKHVIAYIDPEERNKRDFGLFGADWVVYDPNNLENPYQVFDNETSMRNALGLTSILDPYGFTNDFNTSTWTKIGNQEYALVDEIKTAGDQENSILIGRDGNYYLARKNQDGGLEAPKKITDLKLLDEVLQNPEKYNNTIFDQLTAIHDNPTPFPTKNKVNYSIPVYGKFSQGGIMKLGYGNTVQSTNVTSSTKNTEDAKTDITKSHRLDGKDGSLTSAEKMQIGAALGDLAGVALSFAGPVGNIAGAATGLASTATRLVADIKHDGYQGKDVWNAAVGAVLDFASVIPFIGAGAKTAKALKVIKAASSPIMKALSLAGAYEGANAMSKVMAGENITSADLQSIISGLASTVVAGKQFKNTIGDSKLASMLSKKVADATNATKSLKPTATIDGKKIELDLDSVKDQPKSEVLKYIKETSKNTLGRELTNVESKDLLEKFGLSVNKGEYAGMRLKNIFKGKNPVVRKSEKVDFDVPEDISGHGAFYYMFNPFARHKALGRGWHGFSNNKGLLSEVSKNDIKGAQRRIKNDKGSLKDYALMRRTIDNPGAFRNIFEGTPYRLSKFGYPVYLRPLTPIWKQEWTPKMHPVFTADVDAPIKLGSRLNVQLDSQPNTDVLRRRARIASWKGKRLMQPTLTHPYGKYYDDVVIMEKQGGVLKGQYGLNPKNYNLGAVFNKNIEKSVTPWAPGLSIAPVLNAKLDLTLDHALSGKQEPDVSRYIPSSILERSKTIQKKADDASANATQKLIDADIPIKESFEQSEQGGGDSGKGSLPWYKKIEPSDILEAGRVFKSLADVNKLEEIKRKSINAAAFTTNKLQDTNHRYKLYTQPNLRPAVADSRLQSKLFQNSISDMKYAGLYNLSNENTLLKSMLSAADKDSEMINKQDYQKQQLDFERNAINTELSNLDLQRQASLRSAIEGLPAESLVQKSSILDKAGLYLQNRMFLDDKSKYIADQQSEYAATMYDKATTPEAKTYWQTKLSETQKPEYVSSIRKALQYKLAKGGKVRSTSDQMLLDNQKLVAKAIEKMNDNTMKLILKALS